jgi:hypothetical protein
MVGAASMSFELFSCQIYITWRWKDRGLGCHSPKKPGIWRILTAPLWQANVLVIEAFYSSLLGHYYCHICLIWFRFGYVGDSLLRTVQDSSAVETVQELISQLAT